MSEKGHQIEQAADRYRAELLATLEELDRRRGAATDIKGQIDRHKGAAAVAAAGVAVVVGALIAAATLRRRHERVRLRRDRVRGFIRAWEHPRRVASQADYRPLPAEVLRKFAIVFGTVLATSYAKRSARLLISSSDRRKEALR